LLVPFTGTHYDTELIGVVRQILARIKAWVNERAYNGEYTDILIMMTRK